MHEKFRLKKRHRQLNDMIRNKYTNILLLAQRFD